MIDKLCLSLFFGAFFGVFLTSCNGQAETSNQRPFPLNLIPYPASQQNCDSCVTVMEVIRQNNDMKAWQLTDTVYQTCIKTSLRNLEDFCQTVVADIAGYQTQIQNGFTDQRLCELPMPDCKNFWPAVPEIN
ncbi:unnamed protein product, partial [Mesorhabditis belari]|uniref:Saposin B-type domain-containing protein n=1 Tax=Mesorhabditis belari TaxID=2138241 RepID=A0AAF3EPN3_9BILA